MSYSKEMVESIGIWRDHHQRWIADNIVEILNDAYLSANFPGVYISDYPEEREITAWCFFSLVMVYDARP